MKKALISVIWALTFAAPIYLWAVETVSISRINIHTLGALGGHLGAVLMVQSIYFGSRFSFLEKNIGMVYLMKRHALTGGMAVILIIAHGLSMTGENSGVMAYLPLPGLVLMFISFFIMLFVIIGVTRFSDWAVFHKLLPWTFFLYAGHALYFRPPALYDHLSLYYAALVLLAVLAGVSKKIKKHHIFRFPHKITDVEKISHDTWVVRCEKNDLKFLPGQYAYVRTKMNGRLSEEHPFTISSEPTAPYLEFTIKWAGDFTSAVHHLRKGDELIIDGPYGIFSFLMRPPGDVVFIAGGIGITPFISMLRYAYKVKSRHKFILLWGNKRKEDIVFRSEIKEINLGLEKMKVVHVLSRDPGRRSEHGHVDQRIIEKYVESPGSSVFFLCGPGKMMKDIEQALRRMDVERKRILYEKFGF